MNTGMITKESLGILNDNERRRNMKTYFEQLIELLIDVRWEFEVFNLVGIEKEDLQGTFREHGVNEKDYGEDVLYLYFYAGNKNYTLAKYDHEGIKKAYELVKNW